MLLSRLFKSWKLSTFSKSPRAARRNAHRSSCLAAEVLEIRQFPSAVSLGVMEENTLKLDSHAANASGTAADAIEMDFAFAQSGETVLIGNWNGQGSTPVVVRQPGVNGAPNDGLLHWYFATNGDAAFEGDIAFGLAGDVPVVGDWNGDGRDEVGTTRKSGGVGVTNDGMLNWFLSSTTSPTGYIHRKYGFSNDTPVVGNWNGAGGDDLGVVRVDAGNLKWLQDWTGDTNPERIFNFGRAGEQPVVGDWDGNGTDNVGVAITSGGVSLTWSLDTNNDSVENIRRTLNATGTKPIVGNWKFAEIAVSSVGEVSDGQIQSLKIGVADVGSFADRKFTVKNTGNSNLTLETPTLPVGFTLVEGLNSVLAPGATDTFTIRFSPLANGDFPGRVFAGMVTIATNDGNENSFDFSIHGSTPAPEITVRLVANGSSSGINDGQSTVIDFGNSLVNSVGPTRKFRIQNDGTKTLTLEQLQLPTGFSLAAPLTVTSLAPNAFVDVVVKLDTSVVRTAQGQFTITNNDANESPFNFPISGVVSPRTPEITVTESGRPVLDGQAAAIDFGTVLPGAAGVTKTFEIHNAGTAPLTLSVPTLSGSGFTVTQSPVTTIAPNTSATFTIRLNSTSSGAKVATVAFTTNDSDEGSFDFQIRGLVATPKAEITVIGIQDGQSAAVDFGSVARGTTAPVKTFTVSNDGNIPLVLGTVTVPTGFTVVQQPNFSVAPNTTTTFKIQMTTGTAGTKSGSLSFTTNDADESPFNFNIQGVVTTPATAPEISVSIASKVLVEGQTGDLFLGQLFSDSSSASKFIQVTNRGNAPLLLTNPTITGGFATTGPWGQPIAPGVTVQIEVSLSANNSGNKLGNLQFSTNDTTGGEATIRINLTGQVFNGRLGTHEGTVLSWTTVANKDNRIIVVKEVLTFGGSGNNRRVFADFYSSDLLLEQSQKEIGDHALSGEHASPRVVAMENGNFAVAWINTNASATGKVHFAVVTPFGWNIGDLDRKASSAFSSNFSIVSMTATQTGFSIEWRDTVTLRSWTAAMSETGAILSVTEQGVS